MSYFPGVEALITNRQLFWSGYVMRVDDSFLPKQVFSSKLVIDKGKQGGQRKTH